MMLKKTALAVATVLGVSLGAGAVVTPAQALSVPVTVATGEAAPVVKVHGRKRHFKRHHRRHWKHRHGHHRRHWHGHKRWGYGYGPRCHYVKKVVVWYDRFGRPHRDFRRHRVCRWH